MKTIQPVGNYVLLEESAKSETTASGIIIPDSAKEKTQDGIVVGISPEASDQIAIGDNVIYTGYSHTNISHEGKDYLLVQDSDIIAKFVEVDEI